MISGGSECSYKGLEAKSRRRAGHRLFGFFAARLASVVGFRVAGLLDFASVFLRHSPSSILHVLLVSQQKVANWVGTQHGDQFVVQFVIRGFGHFLFAISSRLWSEGQLVVHLLFNALQSLRATIGGISQPLQKELHVAHKLMALLASPLLLDDFFGERAKVLVSASLVVAGAPQELLGHFAPRQRQFVGNVAGGAVLSLFTDLRGTSPDIRFVQMMHVLQVSYVVVGLQSATIGTGAFVMASVVI